MYQQHILGKSLQIVEMFNFISVVAADKTDTLTENKMTVTDILWDTDAEYKVIGSEEEELIKKATIQQTTGDLPIKAPNITHRGVVRVAPVVERLSSGITNQSKLEVFRDLLLGAALCNDAEKQLVQDTQLGQDTSKVDSELRFVGDAVDVALYNLCVYRFHMEIDEVRCLNPRLKILPFNSSNKFMISANRL